MKYAVFEIALEQPVIISRQAASAGAHQSLDYIPGAALLGLAASRLYAELAPAQAWTLFHSGRVRFGDGLPRHESGETGWPMPISLHHYKGEDPAADAFLQADRLFDPALFVAARERQPVQLRGGYTTASGRRLRPEHIQVLKTAIDRDTGMAAESQLFGYSALAAGQCFRFELRADAEVAADLWQQLCQRLQGTARLGRSRSAQFGRVSIRALEGGSPPAPSECGGTGLTLWLLSDLLLSEHGQPCQVPHPHLLGLPEGSQWCEARSFLRGRRYSSYNAYRRRYDSERQVIERGSVLRYQLPRPLGAEERSALQDGLGLMVECGLGAVAVNPALLAGERPRFGAPLQVQAPVRAPAAAEAQPADHEPALLGLLRARRSRRLGDLDAEEKARTLFADLCQRVREARVYNGAAPGMPLDPPPPSRSQWGAIKQLASDYRDDPAELFRLLTDVNIGQIRDRSGWELRFGSYTVAPDQDTAAPPPDGTDRRRATEVLHEWMRAELDKLAGRADFGRIVGHLAAFGLQEYWIRCCEGREGPKEQTQ